MTNWKKRTVLFALLANFTISSAYAQSNWKSFQLGIIGGFQQGRNSFSGQLGWSPLIEFWGPVDVRGRLAAALFNQSIGGIFLAADYELLFSIHVVDALQIELGGGAQTWFNSSGTGPAFSGTVGYTGVDRFMGPFDRIYAGYTAFLVAGATAHEILIGGNLSI